MTAKPDNRSPFEKSIMAMADTDHTKANENIARIIRQWFVSRMGFFPSNIPTALSKITLAERPNNAPGVVFAWDGSCIMEICVEPLTGSAWTKKCPPDFVPIIPKNVLT